MNSDQLRTQGSAVLRLYLDGKMDEAKSRVEAISADGPRGIAIAVVIEALRLSGWSHSMSFWFQSWYKDPPKLGKRS